MICGVLLSEAAHRWQNGLWTFLLLESLQKPLTSNFTVGFFDKRLNSELHWEFYIYWVWLDRKKKSKDMILFEKKKKKNTARLCLTSILKDFKLSLQWGQDKKKKKKAVYLRVWSSRWLLGLVTVTGWARQGTQPRHWGCHISAAVRGFSLIKLASEQWFLWENMKTWNYSTRPASLPP